MSGWDAVLLVAVLFAHGYLWWRLIRSTTRSGRLRRGLTAAFAVLALLVTGALVIPSPPAALGPLQWVTFSWLGVAFYAVLALVVLEPVRLAARLWFGRRRDPPLTPPATRGPAPAATTAADPTRRLLLARGLAVGAGAVAVGTAGLGLRSANGPPVVRRLPITLGKLDPRLDGFRVVAFSDAHLSATYGGRRFERVVELVNAQRPDVVVILGDLVDGALGDLRAAVAPVADLVGEQGVYMVTGNHEHLADAGAWLRHLPTLGVRVLRNERVAVGRGGALVDLAGVDDPSAADPGTSAGAGLDAALAGRDRSRPVILLAHEPARIAAARAAGVDLQLSGHTHGGQLWPFDRAVLWDQPVVEGYARFGDTQLYVTSGVGFWGPPMRVGARPEIVVVELRAPR